MEAWQQHCFTDLTTWRPRSFTVSIAQGTQRFLLSGDELGQQVGFPLAFLVPVVGALKMMHDLRSKGFQLPSLTFELPIADGGEVDKFAFLSEGLNFVIANRPADPAHHRIALPWSVLLVLSDRLLRLATTSLVEKGAYEIWRDLR